jgi:aminoglycoside 3-N-acetyltransferase
VTPARTGIIPETGRRLPGAVRSLSPTHSVAVVGPRSVELTSDHLAFRTFGPGSPVDRVARAGGVVLLVGVDQMTNSAIHLAEEYAGIPKASWYPELPTVRVRMPDGAVIDHRLDDSPSCSGAFNAVEGELRRHDEIADGRIRSCRIQLIEMASVVSRAIALIQTKPDILLCRWRGCRPCVGARERLRTEGRHPSA